MTKHVLGLMAALMTFAAQASEPAPRELAFGPGEQTTYEVTFLGVPTGVAQITVGWAMEQFGRQVWPLVFYGQTTSVAAAFPVKDRFVSYWDPKASHSVGADFFVDENKKRRRERYRYDFSALKAFTTRQHEGAEPSEREFDIAPETMDLAGTAFSLRTTPLKVGDVHELPVFTGVKTYQARATVVAKETLTTKLGQVEVFRVTVNGEFNGKMATKGLMTVYYTADARQFPVKAEAEFMLGSVVLEATRFEPGNTQGAGT